MPAKTLRKPTSAVFAIVEAKYHGALRDLASDTRLPYRLVLEALIANATGYEHPHSQAVRTAANRYRREVNP